MYDHSLFFTSVWSLIITYILNHNDKFFCFVSGAAEAANVGVGAAAAVHRQPVLPVPGAAGAAGAGGAVPPHRPGHCGGATGGTHTQGRHSPSLVSTALLIYSNLQSYLSQVQY